MSKYEKKPINIENCCVYLLIREAANIRTMDSGDGDLDTFFTGKQFKAKGYREIKLFIPESHTLKDSQGSMPIFYVLAAGNIEDGLCVRGVFSSNDKARQAALANNLSAGDFLITPKLAIRDDRCKEILLKSCNSINADKEREHLYNVWR